MMKFVIALILVAKKMRNRRVLLHDNLEHQIRLTKLVLNLSRGVRCKRREKHAEPFSVATPSHLAVQRCDALVALEKC